MNKFRASYSILSKWASGDWEGAVKTYFKLEQFTTPAMADGKQYHQQWQAETDKTKKLPAIFGGKKLKKPTTELKKVVSIAPWCNLVGVIDCYDEPVIYEYKTGKTESEAYANSPQVGIYGILATLSGLYAEKAEIHHFDQHTKKVDVSMVWLTDDRLRQTHDWLITYASEMHNYLTTNNLYERFGYGRNQNAS